MVRNNRNTCFYFYYLILSLIFDRHMQIMLLLKAILHDFPVKPSLLSADVALLGCCSYSCCSSPLILSSDASSDPSPACTTMPKRKQFPKTPAIPCPNLNCRSKKCFLSSLLTLSSGDKRLRDLVHAELLLHQSHRGLDPPSPRDTRMHHLHGCQLGAPRCLPPTL